MAKTSVKARALKKPKFTTRQKNRCFAVVEATASRETLASVGFVSRN